MKHVLLILSVVMGQSLLAADKKPLIADPIVEKEIRRVLKKPEGELTKAGLEKVTRLKFRSTKISDAGLKEVAKLQQLILLGLFDTKVIKAGVIQLRKASPDCKVAHNSTIPPVKILEPWRS